MDTSSSASGILGALSKLGDNLFAILKARVELISLEVHEEKFRLVQIFVWISAAVFTAAMALSFASLTIVYYFWEEARLAALGGLGGFYCLAFLSIVLAFRRYLAKQPEPFASTLEEIERDRECIRDAS